MARLIFNDWLSAWDERLFLAVGCLQRERGQNSSEPSHA